MLVGLRPTTSPTCNLVQTPPGLQQAAMNPPTWDPYGQAFPGSLFQGGFPYGGAVPPPPPPHSGVPPWVQPPQGQDDGSGKGIDVKWIPQVPECKWSAWKTRRDEIQGFWAWIEALCSWLGLLQPLYVPEMKEILERDVSLTADMLSPQQTARSSRLFYLLKSAFAGNKRVEAIIRIFELQQHVGATNGYELVRLLRREYSLKSRTEAIQFRQEILEMKIPKGEGPMEILRTIEAKYLQFRQLLFSCPYPRMIADVDIPESDIYLLILRSMPSSVEQYLRYHCGETVLDLKNGIEFIQSRQLSTGDLGRANAMKEYQDGGKGDWFWYGKGKGKSKTDKGKSKGKGKDDKDKGKSKGKGDKGKGKGQGKSRESSNDSKKGKGKGKERQTTSPNVDKDKAKRDGLCFKCGKPGHQAKDCWSKNSQVRGLDADEEGYEGSEPEKEIFAVFRHVVLENDVSSQANRDHVKSMVQGDREVRGNENPEPEFLPVERISELPEANQRERCDKVGSSDGSKWLIDSGATSHIVASCFLSSYHVVREHDHTRVELRAANDEVIPVVGLVDLSVQFPLPKGKKQKVTLTKVLICNINMNVLSSYVLASNGWKTSLSLDGGFLAREGLICPLSLDDRAWWLYAKDVKRLQSPKKPKGNDMEIGKTEDKPKDPKSILTSILKKDSSKQPETYRHEPSGLTFLLRTARSSHDLSEPVSEVVESSESCEESFHECAEWFDLTDDEKSELDKNTELPEQPVACESVTNQSAEEVPVVPFSVRDVIIDCDLQENVTWKICKTEDGHHVVIQTETIAAEDDRPIGNAEDVEIDTPLESPSLYEHLAQGHVPYANVCEACTRARGRAPARRLKHSKGPYEIACDFTFLGPLKIFVAVVLYTSMVGTVVWSENDETNIRGINSCFREMGLVGKTVEATIDGENLLESVLKRAARLENAAISGMSVETTPPNRSQANGKAERFCGMIKHVTASNLLFLEKQIGKRIALESKIVPFAVRYSGRMLNLFNKVPGSVSTPVERMKDRIGVNKHKTFPFGATVLAKPTDTAHDNPLEYLSHVTYLGPISTTGGGFLGMFSGPSRIGVEDSDKVRRFQVARLETPVKWDIDHLITEGGSIEKDDRKVTPSKELKGKYEDGEETTGERGEMEDEERPQPVQVPSGGPPRAWLDVHGLTPGCYACDGILTKGTAKGRHHNRECKNRYKQWLEEESEKTRKRRRSEPINPPPTPAPAAVPPISLPAEASGSGPQRVSEDVPMEEDDSPTNIFGPNYPQAQPGQGGIPGNPQVVSVPQPAPPVSASDGSAPMELGSLMDKFDYRSCPQYECTHEDDLIIAYILEQDEIFMSLEQSTIGGKWFKTNVCGMTVYQQMPIQPRCENTGLPIPLKGYQEAVVKEFEQLTKLCVGVPHDERSLMRISSEHGIKPIQTRWVIVQKPDGRVRARLVCKDFKFRGGTALQEGIYSPTSTLESLRILLGINEEYGNILCSMDVSTAFLYAPLDKNEHVTVLLPPSTKDEKGSRIGMKLQKALYGLRRAPLRWYKELVRVLKDLRFEPTSDSTLFRKAGQGGQLCLILIYVDDSLISCPSVSMKQKIISDLSACFELKETGMISHKPGRLEFLGRSILRESENGPLSLGLPAAYYDGIEEALGMQLSSQQNPPDITRYAVEKEREKYLGVQEASRYRTVLGKLAWLSLTFPSLSFYVSFLSSYQQTPTEQAMTALKLVLKWTKFYRGSMLSVQTNFNHYDNGEQVVSTVDASWALKSQMGGYVHWRNYFLKSWSRRIPVTMLSSAEAELFALIEGLKEGIASSLIVETVIHGMPRMDRNHQYEYQTGTFHVKLRSDSEGAGNIARMTGLLRRVRHLELRVAYLQENIETGRASVSFVPGAYNGADVLTKVPAKGQLTYFHEDVGLVFPEEIKVATQETSMLFEDLKHLSARNRFQVVQAVGRVLGKLSELGWKWTCNRESHIPRGVSLKNDVSSSGGIPAGEVQKRVRFSEIEEVHAIPKRLPEALNTFLKKEKRFEPWRESLTMLFAGCDTAFIEICCQESSSLEEVTTRKGLAYFGVSQKIDLTYSRTIWLLRQIIQKCPKVYIHISTPCTSGSRIRHLNFVKYPNTFSRWQQQFRLHRKIWSGIRKVLCDVKSKKGTLVSQEWPKDCDLFKELVYLRVQKLVGLSHTAIVKRCCLDGIRKEWIFKANDRNLAVNLMTPFCRCERPEVSQITASGYYSKDVACHILDAFQGVKL